VTLAKYLKLFAATQQPSHENLQSSLRKFRAYIEAPVGKREAFLAQMNEGKTVMVLHSLWNRVNDDINLQLTILQTLICLVRADKETLHSTTNDVYTFFVPELVDILESCVDPSDKSYNSIAFFGLCAELLDSHCSGKAGKTTCETLLRNVPLRNRIFAIIQMSAALPSAQVQLYILLLSNRLFRYASLIRSGLFTSVLESISSFQGITKDDIIKISVKVDGSSTNDFRKIARDVRLDASERVRSGVVKLNRETVPNSADAWVEAMKDLSTAGVFSFAADSVVISCCKEGDQNVTEPGSACEFLDLSLLGFGSSIFVKTESDGKNPKGSLTSDANQKLGAIVVLQHSWPQVTRVSCNVEEQTVSFHTNISNQEASAMILYGVSSSTDLNLDLTAAYHFPNKAELGSAVDCLHLLLPSNVPLEVSSSKPSSKSSKAAKTFTSPEPSESYHAAGLASRAAGGLPSTIKPMSPSPSDAARSKFGIPIQKAMTTTANATHSEVAHLQNLKVGKTVKISKSGEIRNVAIKSASASAIFQEEEEKVDHRANDEEEEEADEGKEEAAGAKMDETDAKDAEIKEKDDDADTADPDAEKDSGPAKLDVNMEAEDANDIDVATTKPQKVAEEGEKEEEEEDEDLSAWQQQTTHENEPQTSLTQAPAEPERPVQETAASETIASETRVNKSKKKAAKRSSEMDAIDDKPLPARKARGLVNDKVGVYVDQSNEDDAVVDEEGSRKRSRSDRQAKGRTGGDEKNIEQGKNAHVAAKAPTQKGRKGELVLVTGATKPSGTIAGIVNSKGAGSSKQQHPQALTTATTKKPPFAAKVLPPRPPPPPPPQASSANKSALKPPGATFKSAEKPGSDQFDFDENDKKDKLTKTKVEKKKDQEEEDEEEEEERDVNPSSTKKSKLSDAAIAAEAFVPLTSSSGKYVTPALQLTKSSLHPKVPAVKEKDKKSKLYDDDNEYDFNEVDEQHVPQPVALPSKPPKPAGGKATAAAATAAASKPSPQELQTGKRRAKEMAAQKTDKAAAAASEAAAEAATAAAAAESALKVEEEEAPPRSKFAPTTVAETEIEEAEKEVEDEKKKKMMMKKKKKEEEVVVVAMDDDDNEDREDLAPYHHPVDDKPRKRAKTDASHQADLQKKKAAVEDDSPVQPSVSVMPTKAAAETKKQPLFSKLESKSSHSTAPPMTSSTKKKNKLKMDEEATTREKPIASAYSGVGVMEDGSQIMNPIPFGLDEDVVHFAAIGLDNTAASAVVSASSAEPERQMSELLASDNEGDRNNNDDDDDDDHDRQLKAALREQCEDILDSLSKTLDHHEKRLLATLERDELSGHGVPRGSDMSLDDARDTIPNYVEAIEKSIAKAEGIYKAGTVRYNATVAECEAFMKKQASQLRKVETSYKEQVSAIDQHRAEMTAFADGLVKSTAKAAERAVAEFKTKETGLKADYKKFTEKINKKKRLSEETIKGFF